MDIKKKLQEWKNENPIKKYRKENHLSQNDTASILGVSTYTIQRWEDGAVNPSGDNNAKLNKLINNFDQQWNEWKNNQPKL